MNFMSLLIGKVTLALILFCIIPFTSEAKDSTPSKSIYDFKVKDINGKFVSLSDYKGKVIIIVNVASECGYVKQYEGLQKMYEKYKGQGLVILGFPCNQFGFQEPGTEEEIKTFCESNYHITFPMFSKIDVNDEKADPLYVYLKSQTKDEIAATPIKWNFEKFVIDRKGNVVARKGSKTTPAEMKSQIEKLLKS